MSAEDVNYHSIDLTFIEKRKLRFVSVNLRSANGRRGIVLNWIYCCATFNKHTVVAVRKTFDCYQIIYSDKPDQTWRFLCWGLATRVSRSVFSQLFPTKLRIRIVRKKLCKESCKNSDLLPGTIGFLQVRNLMVRFTLSKAIFSRLLLYSLVSETEKKRAEVSWQNSN